MSKISLNPKYTNNSGNSWSTTTYNSLEYHISTNKNHSTVSTLKCEFTTPYDNIDVVIEIGSSSENNFDWCYVGNLDNSSPSYNNNYLDRISGYIGSSYSPTFKKVTINVAKAGTHFLIIGYRKDGSGSSGKDCGYFRLVTTEVDSMEPTKYIYCGTKKKLEPIEFSKDNKYGTGFGEYSGSDERLQWANKFAGSDFERRSRISFKTTSDNITVTLIYERYFNANADTFVASSIDGSLTFTNNDYVYIAGPGQGVVTKEITVSKAGEHYIDIGYVLINSESYIRVGFSGSNIILNALTPESIFANNRDIDKVYVGSELIWEKSIIMWFQYNQEITFANRYDGGTTNDRVTIPANTYDNFSYGNNVISGSNYNYSSAYYGLNVKDIIKNGYIYPIQYQIAMDLSAFPNPVNMEHIYGWHKTNNCFYLKINPKLKKETTNLSHMFNGFAEYIHNGNKTMDEPSIVSHKACNVVGLDKLNTGNVTNMSNMFSGAHVIGNLDFSNWDTSKVTNMSYMFWHANGLNENKYKYEYRIENYSYLTGLNNWNLQSVQDMSYMFNSSTYYDFQDKELAWDTSNITDMSRMFTNCNAYNFPKLSFDTRNVTNMAYMFRKFESYNDLKLNFTDTSKVTDMSGMFGFCDTNDSRNNINVYYFSYLNYNGDADISCLDTSNVVNAHDMFNGCKYITPDKIKNIRLPKATNIKNMFRYAYMGGWDFANKKTAYIDTIDLSSFDLGSISTLDSMSWAFAFGGAPIWANDDKEIDTYIGNLILDNWKCFQSYTNHDFTLSKYIAPFRGCHVTYCYMRGCNDNTKIVLKKMLGLNSTYALASCKYFIED